MNARLQEDVLNASQTTNVTAGLHGDRDLTAPQPAQSLIPTEPAPSAPANLDRSPAGLMLMAMERGASLEQIEKMMDLQERWERREAEKAFNAAMAAFKGVAIEIVKRKRVHFENSKGGVTDYKHAELYDVIEAAGPSLSQHGFSWNWKHKQANGFIETTCFLKHKLGHTDECTLIAPYDQSGGKNAIQAVISAKTYLERHTLKSIAGLAEKGEDDDGSGSGNRGDRATDKRHGAHPEQGSDTGKGATDPKAYPQAKFDKNLPTWRAAIEGGRQSPERVIATVESLFKLSDEQKKTIRNLVPAA